MNSDEFSKIEIASLLVVTPGVMFCQQGGWQVGWASHIAHQFVEITGVMVGVGVFMPILWQDTPQMSTNPYHTDNLINLIFMAHLPGERVLVMSV